MSSRRSPASESCKLYVGNLTRHTDERELESIFKKYGVVRSVWMARNPPGFGFVEYEDPRDADDAVKRVDGMNLCGVRIRCEHARGKSRPKPWMRGGGGGRNSYDNGRDGGRGGGVGRRRSRSRSRSSRSDSPVPRRSPDVRRPRSRSRSRS